MHLFTVEQTESWQQAILSNAAKQNALDELCWFVQMILPPPPKSMARKMTQKQREDYRFRTACAPRDWIPYIPVGCDPISSRQAAEVLAAIFAAHNAPDLKFAPALCLSADLAKQKSYEFGREWDHVCSRCGGVFASTVPNEVPVCAGCAVVLYRMAMY